MSREKETMEYWSCFIFLCFSGLYLTLQKHLPLLFIITIVLDIVSLLHSLLAGLSDQS